MDISRVIIRPLVTEKTNSLQQQAQQKVFAFVVDPKANKHLIASAFSMIFGFYPTKINTTTRKPAKIRTGTIKPGYSKLTKIAYITLPEGKNISISSEQTSQENTSLKKDEVKKTETIKTAKAKGQLKEVSTNKVEKPKESK